jgi:hypothetical protein
MPRWMLDESRELTHRRLTPPACRRAVPRAGRGGRADQREPAFARSKCFQHARRVIEAAEAQVRSGVPAFSAGAGVGGVITRDPLDGVDGTTDVANPYAYVSNDPLNMVDPRGLRKQDSDRDWKPPPPPVMQPSDCALYRTGKIRDYLHGAEQPPCGFKDAVYTPDVIRGFHGNATVYAGPADKVDACSGKMLTLVSNTITNPFSGTSSEEVERAYKEFDVSCRAHDYAYDLIRFAWNNEDWKSRVNGRSDLVRDREDADGEMREISTGVCNDASWVAWRDVWDKFVCWKLRDLMYNGLRVWTKVEGIPK